jgi:hypothetical protein
MQAVTLLGRWHWRAVRDCAARLRARGYRVELDERNVDGVLAVFFIDGEATAVAHLEALVAWLDGAGRRPEPPPARDGLG